MMPWRNKVVYIAEWFCYSVVVVQKHPVKFALVRKIERLSVTGNPTALQIHKQSFFEFLSNYRSLLPKGNEISDLARDVLNDAKASKANTRLIDYLNRRSVAADVIDKALKAWKESRDE